VTSGTIFAEIVLAVIAVGIAVGAPLMGMNLQHRSESWEATSDDQAVDATADEVDERELVSL
jgi:hypothetical protein